MQLKRPKRTLLLLIATVALLIFAGTIIIKSRAASTAYSAEPETGSLSSGASAITDTSASGSGAVLFQHQNTVASSQMGIMSWNRLSSNPMSNVTSFLNSLTDADVISLQEMQEAADRQVLVDSVLNCATCKYDGHVPASSEGGRNSIIWKKSTISMLSKGFYKVYGAGIPIEDGASGTSSWDTYITWVRLANKATGRTFYVFNNHFIPTIDVGGSPDPNRPKRVALYDQNMTMLLEKLDEARATGDPVIVTGDFNIDYAGDAHDKDPIFPYVRLGAHNTWANWRYLGTAAGPTHTNRFIDYVCATRDTRLVPISQVVKAKNGSDHSPVLVQFTATP